MKMYAESRRNIHECKIQWSQQVLLKSVKSGKLEPWYQKGPFVAVERKVQMLIAQPGDEVKARNSSQVAPIHSPEDPSQVEMPELKLEPDARVHERPPELPEVTKLDATSITVVNSRSARLRPPPIYLNDFVTCTEIREVRYCHLICCRS